MPARASSRYDKDATMTTAADTLRTIEMNAERAIVQELRIMIRDVLDLRSQLTHEDRDHADALLLKLDRLVRDQRVETVHSAGAAAALVSLRPGHVPAPATSRAAA